jgi:protein-disulfide isomerase
MRERKILILSTLAFFALALGAIGVYRSTVSPRVITINSELYPSMGNREAKIEILVFEDLSCHTCRYFTLEVFPAIQATYIAPGLVKYVMIPVSFLPNSQEIANAALAIFYQEPQSFFPFVHALFARYLNKKVDLEELVELAKEFEGIDLASFEESVKSGRFDQQLDQNLKVATKAMKKNVKTPSIFINGVPISGISFESIASSIEALK